MIETSGVRVLLGVFLAGGREGVREGGREGRGERGREGGREERRGRLVPVAQKLWVGQGRRSLR